MSYGSSSALGVGVGTAPAELGATDVSSDTSNAPANVSIEGNKVTITGKPSVGDIFKFDVNGTEINHIQRKRRIF